MAVQLFRTIRELRDARESLPKTARGVGFVPTMGALHEGHMSLVKKALERHDFVFLSIFVNPTQFAPHEDLDKYPRQLEADQTLVSKIAEQFTDSRVVGIFAPSNPFDMYPVGLEATLINPRQFSQTAEAKSRPQFLSGVATVVVKLLNLVEADTAYFGQKDIVQALMLRQTATDLFLKTEIRVCPTYRKTSGLASSSRNAYLTSEEFEAAAVVYRSLQKGIEVSKNFVDASEDAATAICSAVKEVLESEPKERGDIKVDYVSLGNPSTGEDTAIYNPAIGGVLSVALWYGENRVRLIDNVLLGPIADQLLV